MPVIHNGGQADAQPSGPQLYDLYRQALPDKNAYIDEWDDLGPEDQEAWNELANQVRIVHKEIES